MKERAKKKWISGVLILLLVLMASCTTTATPALPPIALTTTEAPRPSPTAEPTAAPYVVATPFRQDVEASAPLNPPEYTASGGAVAGAATSLASEGYWWALHEMYQAEHGAKDFYAEEGLTAQEVFEGEMEKFAKKTGLQVFQSERPDGMGLTSFPVKDNGDGTWSMWRFATPGGAFAARPDIPPTEDSSLVEVRVRGQIGGTWGEDGNFYVFRLNEQGEATAWFNAVESTASEVVWVELVPAELTEWVKSAFGGGGVRVTTELIGEKTRAGEAVWLVKATGRVADGTEQDLELEMSRDKLVLRLAGESQPREVDYRGYRPEVTPWGDVMLVNESKNVVYPAGDPYYPEGRTVKWAEWAQVGGEWYEVPEPEAAVGEIPVNVEGIQVTVMEKALPYFMPKLLAAERAYHEKNGWPDVASAGGFAKLDKKIPLMPWYSRDEMVLMDGWGQLSPTERIKFEKEHDLYFISLIKVVGTGGEKLLMMGVPRLSGIWGVDNWTWENPQINHFIWRPSSAIEQGGDYNRIYGTDLSVVYMMKNPDAMLRLYYEGIGRYIGARVLMPEGKRQQMIDRYDMGWVERIWEAEGNREFYQNMNQVMQRVWEHEDSAETREFIVKLQEMPLPAMSVRIYTSEHEEYYQKYQKLLEESRDKFVNETW